MTKSLGLRIESYPHTHAVSVFSHEENPNGLIVATSRLLTFTKAVRLDGVETIIGPAAVLRRPEVRIVEPVKAGRVASVLHSFCRDSDEIVYDIPMENVGLIPPELDVFTKPIIDAQVKVYPPDLHTGFYL